jgi:hypothetical protein
MNADYRPHSTNKHVENTGEPGARGVSVAVNQMVLLWTARASMLASQTTGLERPTPGAGALVLAARPRGSVHGVEEASSRSENVGDGRPVRGKGGAGALSGSVGVGRPGHGVGEADAGGRVLVLAAPSTGSPFTGWKRPVPGLRVLVSAAPSTG